MKGEKPFTLTIITATHNRANILRYNALASLLQQSRLDFEWIVINDGRDKATQHLIQSTPFPFPHQYLEIDHPVEEFGLCIARNLGIKAASSNYVCYLDDDNSFRPAFVGTILDWIEQYPHSRFILPQQWRRRDVIQEGKMIKQGKLFISPSADTTLDDLVCQQALFDSNGFVHRRLNSLGWNPQYRVFCDYEFFLQCLSQ
ncbi:glycosyltransferase family 2 protein [Acaryochloris sp. CCMEE 5410]|nr:glycosyltransferase family 2 protein [Acaryochloris sp. CCMEE 5410]